jgi:hypothetical protein
MPGIAIFCHKTTFLPNPRSAHELRRRRAVPPFRRMPPNGRRRRRRQPSPCHLSDRPGFWGGRRIGRSWAESFAKLPPTCHMTPVSAIPEPISSSAVASESRGNVARPGPGKRILLDSRLFLAKALDQPRSLPGIMAPGLHLALRAMSFPLIQGSLPPGRKTALLRTSRLPPNGCALRAASAARLFWRQIHTLRHSFKGKNHPRNRKKVSPQVSKQP